MAGGNKKNNDPDRGAGVREEESATPADDMAHRGAVSEHIAQSLGEQSFEPKASRSAGETVKIRLDEYQPDDVVELELEGGVRLYTTLADLLNDAPDVQRSRGPGRTDAGEVVLPMALPLAGGARAGDEWAAERLKILKIGLSGLAEFAGETAGEQVCAWYEAKQLQRSAAQDRPSDSLWRCDPEQFALSEFTASSVGTTEPMLLLIHGTASSTLGSFGQLWQSDKPEIREIRTRLFSGYPERIFAFEHRSLTQSPVTNAINLARALPDRARLHLITHSRGGLIGELLCRGTRAGHDGISALEIKRFYDGRRNEGEELRELSRLLKKKQIGIDRFVRVACPARGTTLASGRLDRWLSLVLHLVGRIPALKASGFYGVLEEFTKAFVKTRTKPDKLPGLAAMMPDSPLIGLLNSPGVEVAADLHVIAGDIEGGSLWRKMGVLLTDLFYTFEDHDLIVNTAAMYGGAERTGGARYLFTQGPEVFHFNYFGNPETAGKLIPALQAQPVTGDGFTAFSPAKKRASRAALPSGTRAISGREAARPTLFLLPGSMGSELSVERSNGELETIWLDAKELSHGRIRDLAIEAPKVVATGVIERAYGPLADYLESHYRVVRFPYDWRLPLDTEAARLAAAISDCLDGFDASAQPVCILAHSSGGLLARLMIARRPALWQRMLAHPQSRLVMLGTPNAGSHAVLRMLLGRDGLLQGLAMVDSEHTLSELLAIFTRYPGLLTLLPAAENGQDYFDPKFWQHLRNVDSKGRAVTIDASLLAEAQAVRGVLDQETANPERLVYVAGCAPETAARLLLEDRPKPILPKDWLVPGEDDPVHFQGSPRGDGWVLWDSGMPGWLRNRYYVDAAHGDLATFTPVFPAILDLLQTGKTDELRTSEPAVNARGGSLSGGGTASLRSAKPAMLPTQQQLEDSALGRSSGNGGSSGGRINVSMVHGNLAFARHLVMVGHYQGDTIISAEAHIDRRLNGQLSRRNQLGLYPGPLNTSHLFRDREGDFPGAMVVGLGKVGDLTPGTLTETFCRALLDYALATLEEKGSNEAQGRSLRELSVSSLLIGTTAGGIPVRDAISALLRGMQRANDALRQWKLHETVRFAAIEFVELYQDLAIQAAAKINEAIGDPDLNAVFEPVASIDTRDGGRRRVSFEEAPGWWDRLQIVADALGRLRFTALTDRARTEVSLLPTQRALVDQFLDQATSAAAADDHVAGTLFELLLPNELKEHTREQRDLVLILDDGAASYPWELMYDGLGRFERALGDDRHAPLAVKAGMIRQRETEDFRRQVVASSEPNLLIVGDPDLTDAGSTIRSLFPQLEGARTEAEEIAALFYERHGGRHLHRVINGRFDQIVCELFARPYRMLHLAGHGAYRFAPLRNSRGEEVAEMGPGSSGGYGNARVSGMVIGRTREQTVDGDPCERYILLTPAEVEQMRFVPEMVFINCCFGGTDREPLHPMVRSDRHRLAANVATQLIRMGVRAVIAAGWAVDDRAAVTFARTFYELMLEGERFGYAVQQARKKIFVEHPGVNTWGAYQCYGDPDFRLFADGPSRGREQGRPRRYLAEADLATDIANLSEDAKTADADASLAQLRSQLADLERQAMRWENSGTLAEALGRAYAELDQFPEAIRYYQKALECGSGDLRFAVLEQLANLRARWAVSMYHSGAKEGEPPKALIDRAIQDLELLIQLSPSAERYRLLGSAHKRASILAENMETWRGSLRAMRESYEIAMKLDGDPPRGYSVTNALTARFLHGFLEVDPSLNADAEKFCAGVDAWRDTETRRDPDFWALSERGDTLNVCHLLQGTLSEYREDVIGAYREAARRAVSPRQWRSVVDHFEFLIDALERLRVAASDPAGNDRAVQLLEALKPMLAELKTLR